MTCRRFAVLTIQREAAALANLSRIEMKGSGSWAFRNTVYSRNWPKCNYKIPNSEYLDKCLSFNKLFCYKCMEQINIGDEYTSLSKRIHITKHYHSSCYERMHY